MRTRPLMQWSAAIGVAGMLAATALTATAAPVPSSTVLLKSVVASDVSEVRWRGRGGGGVAAGILGGMLLGGMIASSPYYYGGPGYYPPGYYGPVYGPRYGAAPGGDAYCFSRYRSFDPVSGTYMGFDGLRHPCP